MKSAATGTSGMPGTWAMTVVGVGSNLTFGVAYPGASVWIHRLHLRGGQPCNRKKVRPVRQGGEGKLVLRDDLISPLDGCTSSPPSRFLCVCILSSTRPGGGCCHTLCPARVNRAALQLFISFAVGLVEANRKDNPVAPGRPADGQQAEQWSASEPMKCWMVDCLRSVEGSSCRGLALIDFPRFLRTTPPLLYR